MAGGGFRVCPTGGQDAGLGDVREEGSPRSLLVFILGRKKNTEGLL